MELRTEFNKDFAVNRIPLSINYLRWPPHLQVHILDLEDRQQYANDILTHCEKWLKFYKKEKYARLYLEEWDQIKRFCDYLEHGETLVQERIDFSIFINEADARRETNFLQIFPEYINFVK
jgi:hypothetical protein